MHCLVYVITQLFMWVLGFSSGATWACMVGTLQTELFSLQP